MSLINKGDKIAVPVNNNKPEQFCFVVGTVKVIEGKKMRVEGWSIKPTEALLIRIIIGIEKSTVNLNDLFVDGVTRPFEGIVNTTDRTVFFNAKTWAWLSEWLENDITNKLVAVLEEHGRFNNAPLSPEEANKLRELRKSLKTESALLLIDTIIKAATSP